MIPIVVLRAAQSDLSRAARFYEEEAAGLGAEFLNQIELAFTRLSEHPEIGAPLPTGARTLLVRRFPFLLIYRAESDRIVLLAAAHQRRHPDSGSGVSSSSSGPNTGCTGQAAGHPAHFRFGAAPRP